MISGQFEPPGRQRVLTSSRSHSRLLQRHPVLIPVILIVGSLALYAASFFADNLFPLLTLIGAPTGLFCLSIAIVSGVSGVLASIISIIEGIDRRRLRAATFPKSKGA